MDFKELFKLLFVLICLVASACAIVLLFGEVRPEYPMITFYVVKALGLCLGAGAYKGLKYLGLLRWLNNQLVELIVDRLL